MITGSLPLGVSSATFPIVHNRKVQYTTFSPVPRPLRTARAEGIAS